MIVVRDDGAGFVADGEPPGFGLAGMRERIAFTDGEIEIETSPGRRHRRPGDAPRGARTAEALPPRRAAA